MKIGGNANKAIRYVSSDPDGVLTAPRGTLAIDTTTGVRWVNRSGSTRWDPSMDIPPEQGWIEHHDRLFRTRFATSTVATGAATDSGVTAGREGVSQIAASAVGDVAIIRSTTVDVVFGDGKSSIRGAITLNSTLSDGTNNFTVRWGWGDALTAVDHTDGIYLECSRATNGDNNWRLVTANNGVYTRVDTAVAPTASTYQSMELVVNAAGTLVTAYIDGTSVATASTNIPTAVGRSSSFSFMIIKDLGSAARSALIDWVREYHLLTTPRT